MPVCPRCNCTSCVSNKFENVPFNQIAGDALAVTRSGRKADAFSNLVAWVGLQAANYVRNPWRCPHCGHTF